MTEAHVDAAGADLRGARQTRRQDLQGDEGPGRGGQRNHRRRCATDAVLDAGLIAAAQKVEHYEIASYGVVRTWARQLRREKAADFLQRTLNEEGEADQKLTALAENLINPEPKRPGTMKMRRAEERFRKTRRDEKRRESAPVTDGQQIRKAIAVRATAMAFSFSIATVSDCRLAFGIRRSDRLHRSRGNGLKRIQSETELRGHG